MITPQSSHSPIPLSSPSPDGRVKPEVTAILEETRNWPPLAVALEIHRLRELAKPVSIDLAPENQRLTALVSSAIEDADEQFIASSGGEITVAHPFRWKLSYLRMFTAALLGSMPHRGEARMGDAARWRVFRRLFHNYPPGSELVMRKERHGDNIITLMIGRRDDLPGRELRWNEPGHASVDDVLDHVLAAAHRDFEAKEGRG